MNDTNPDLANSVLEVVADVQSRLDEWLEGATYDSFGPPERPCIPNKTLKLLPKESVAQIVVHFLTRVSRSSRAIVVLCQQDLAVEAQSVLRSLVESTIDLRFISTNPQPLVSLWSRHENALRYKYLSSLPEDQRPSDYGRCEKDVHTRLRQLNRHEAKRTGKPWTLSDLTKDWSLSSLARRDAEACKLLDLEEGSLYVTYKLLCGSTHGGTVTVLDFIARTDDGAYKAVSCIPGRKMCFVAIMTLKCLMECIRATARSGGSIDIDDWDLDLDSLPESAELTAAALNDFSVLALP